MINFLNDIRNAENPISNNFQFHEQEMMNA